jgi:hypothetical protein
VNASPTSSPKNDLGRFLKAEVKWHRGVLLSVGGVLPFQSAPRCGLTQQRFSERGKAQRPLISLKPSWLSGRPIVPVIDLQIRTVVRIYPERAKSLDNITESFGNLARLVPGEITKLPNDLGVSARWSAQEPSTKLPSDLVIRKVAGSCPRSPTKKPPSDLVVSGRNHEPALTGSYCAHRWTQYRFFLGGVNLRGGGSVNSVSRREIGSLGAMSGSRFVEHRTALKVFPGKGTLLAGKRFWIHHLNTLSRKGVCPSVQTVPRRIPHAL